MQHVRSSAIVSKDGSFIDSENSGPAVMQDAWMQVQGDITILYLAKSAISHDGDRRHWLDMQQCSLSIARHGRTPANRTTHQPRHDWGHDRHDARTSIIVQSMQCSSRTDAVVAVGPTESENSAAAIHDQTAHSQDEHGKADWQT